MALSADDKIKLMRRLNSPPKIIEELIPSVIEGMKKAAELVANTARQNAPVRTGRLKTSIYGNAMQAKRTISKRGVFKGRVYGYVGSHCGYGGIVEVGSHGHPGKPYIMPALMSNREEVRRIICEIVKAAVDAKGTGK